MTDQANRVVLGMVEISEMRQVMEKLISRLFIAPSLL
ncbi:MAG: hypothetical protein ACI9R3_005084 [Verrucomicrobiales bacterium]|jgi:hypothetical protein